MMDWLNIDLFLRSNVLMLLVRLFNSFWNLVPIPSLSLVSIPVRLLHVLGRDVVPLPVPKYIRAAL
jgi:hypothetical protein